ncbi:zinc finger protein 726 [Folsomia candida]|uniref:Zinc finger protein 83 n=1 Tax=Folsomia candida TaxID=158441 RepID=A0A226DL04_FOLCA|nr:zinc finger protein 726 [Folsomia candida]XP_035713492.1 zinc finger protein 726 [Folsomia candida]XP_035713493.1 zinc finger protein 726 [Folsomia candida]OXA45291.1 Zinc finger protein 83 [Folsomia candida]
MDLKPGKKWGSPKCSKTFETYNGLTRHSVCHDSDAKVKCEICSVICKNRPTLSSHKWRFHSNRKRPSCHICHGVFSSSISLRNHIEIMHSKKERPRLPCTFPGCGKTYLTKGNVVRHVQIEHTQNSVRFPCTLCGKEFKRRNELEQHIPTHTTEKPHKCATCGRSFAHKGTLTSHEMTHLEKSTRPVLQCHVCPQTFLSRSALQSHIRVEHENQRNYPCALCNKRYSKPSYLKRHVVARHAANKELIHSCDKCEYRTHAKANLAYHRLHHNAARYGCYFCGKKFFTSNQLVPHCRVHTLEK